MIITLALLGALVWQGCIKKKDKALPEMRLTLNGNDAQPLGGKVWKHLALHALNSDKISTNTQTFSQWYQSSNLRYSAQNNVVYMLAAPKLTLYTSEAEEMTSFLRKGNTMIVVTDAVNEVFTEIFEVAIKNEGYIKSFPWLPKDTHRRLYKNPWQDTTRYGFFFAPILGYLVSDSNRIQDTLSLNEAGQPDGIRLKYGTGELILITNSAGLTNYFLLTGHNTGYANGILSYVPHNPDWVVWDDFYWRNPIRQPENRGILGVLLSIPAMRWAFWLVFVLLAFWVITNMFRKQRIIPLRNPNRNATVEFAQTIARLYYNRKDNSNIALKMIHYFTDQLRSRYYLPRQQLDEAYARLLAAKTNLPLDDMQALVSHMAQIQQGGMVSDESLLHLNRQIDAVMRQIQS